MLYEVRQKGKSGYIDAQGKIVVPISADSCLEFGHNLGGVVRGRHLEIINEKGTVIGACQDIFVIGTFSEGKLGVTDKGHVAKNPQLPVGYLDERGQWAIVPKFRQAKKFRSGVAVASVSYGKMKHLEGLIDPVGNWLVEPTFDSILSFGLNMKTTIARLKENGRVRCYLIDKTGRRVGTDHYSFAHEGGEGLIPVSQNGKFGCVDEHGKVVIPFAFEHVESFSDGLATASAGDEKIGAIDKNGHWAVRPVFVSLGRFVEGIAPAQVNDDGVYKWGYVDRKGHWVIEPQFEEAFDFSGGVAEVIPLGVDPDTVEQARYIT